MISKLTICFCILVAISLVVLPLVYVAAMDELNSVTCGPNGCHVEYTNYTNYNDTTQGGE